MAEFLGEQNTRLCDNCKREIPEFNFTMHEIHCQRNISVCRLCKEPLPKTEMEAHLETEHCQVTCKCNKKLEKRQLQRHEEAECPLRLALCQHCDLELSVAKLKEHEDYCGARTELCGNCGHNVLVKDLKTHPGVCGKDQEGRRAGTATSPNARDQSWGQDRMWIASQLLRHIEALDPPTRLTRRPLRDFESDLFHSHSQSPELRNVETQFPIHSNLLEERERQERNQSRQPSRAISDDSANLDYMLALSLQNEGQAPSVAQQDLWKDMCEANPGRDGLSAPDDSPGAGETLLPCEFCEELYPEELLIDHQTSCNPSCAFPPVRPNIPSPKSAEDPDVIFQKLLQEAARNQLDSLMGLDSSGPAEESVIIPCEFCGVQLEEEVLFHHQDQCDQRPVTASHPVMEGIPRQDSRPQATSPELPKRRIRHQGDLSFGYMDNIKQIKGPAYPLPTLNNGVPPYNQLSASTPGSRPMGHLSPPQVLKLNNLDSQELRGRNRIGHSGVPAPEHSPAVHSVRNLHPENLAPPFPRGPVGRYGASGRNIPITTTSASHRSRAAKAKAPKQPGAGGAEEEEEE